jgi:hypothetical protein
MLRAGAAAGTAAALGAAGVFAAGKASAATTAGRGKQGLPGWGLYRDRMARSPAILAWPITPAMDQASED